MRRRLLLGLGAAALAGACGKVSGGQCDQAALRAAAEATDAMMTAWSPASGVSPDYGLAVRGVQDACPGLPRGFHGYLKYSVQPQPELPSHRFEPGVPLRDDPEGLRPLRA